MYAFYPQSNRSTFFWVPLYQTEVLFSRSPCIIGANFFVVLADSVKLECPAKIQTQEQSNFLFYYVCILSSIKQEYFFLVPLYQTEVRFSRSPCIIGANFFIVLADSVKLECPAKIQTQEQSKFLFYYVCILSSIKQEYFFLGPPVSNRSTFFWVPLYNRSKPLYSFG